MSIEERIDNWASDVLELLGDLIPEVNDDALLGELVLKRALETYQWTNKQINQHSKGGDNA